MKSRTCRESLCRIAWVERELARELVREKALEAQAAELGEKWETKWEEYKKAWPVMWGKEDQESREIQQDEGAGVSAVKAEKVAVTSDGEANFWGLASTRNWVARIQFNGEMSVSQQQELAGRCAKAVEGVLFNKGETNEK